MTNLLEKILTEGGSLVVHPDTWKEYVANYPENVSYLAIVLGIDVITSEYVEPGKFVAIAKQKEPLLEFKPLDRQSAGFLRVQDRLSLNVAQPGLAFLATVAADEEPWDAIPDSDDPWVDLLVFSAMQVAIETHGLPPWPEGQRSTAPLTYRDRVELRTGAIPEVKLRDVGRVDGS